KREFISESPGDPILEKRKRQGKIQAGKGERFHSIDPALARRPDSDTRVRAGPTDTIRGGCGAQFAGSARGTYGKYSSQRAIFVEGMFTVSKGQLQIGTVVSMPFDENTYIVNWDGQNDCIVFDPGFEPDAIVEYLEKNSLVPAAVVCTHG